MIGEGFLIRLADTLGIPLGAKRSKAKNSLTNGEAQRIDLPEQVLIISEITRDDVCLTKEPVFVNTKRLRLGKQLKARTNSLADAFNKIIRSVAFDVLTQGYSVYKFRKVDDEVFFEPIIEALSFFLVDNKITVVIDNKVIKDLLVFVNYEKRDLETSEYEGQTIIQIIPVGLQTRYTKKIVDKLVAAEDSLARLRAQTRYIRFATVEVGLNKGDDQQELVDDVSEGLNANSQDLLNTESFDDQITVFPTRKGIGAPDVKEFIPTTNIGELTDIEYYQTRLATLTRFPKSYSDFSTNLSATALSMIRGDIRYERLVTVCQTVCEEGFDRFLKSVPQLLSAEINFRMKSIASSEDTDILDTISNAIELAESLFSIIEEEEDVDVARQKLNIVLTMLESLKENGVVASVKKELNDLIALKYATPEPDAEPGAESDAPEPDELDNDDFDPDEDPPE